jgi:neutral amino acid transport system ATP-binding protein
MDADSTGRAGLAGVPTDPGARKPDPLIVGDNISRAFGGLKAVDVEHLEIQRGVITALIGPNGAGKTTLFNLLTGFDTPDTGDWSFNGKPLSGVAAYKVARRGMVRTFQLTKVLSKLTVIENMRLGATGQRGERFWSAPFKSLWSSGRHPSSRCGPRRRTRSRVVPTSCWCASSSTPSARTSPARSRAVSASSSRWRAR